MQQQFLDDSLALSGDGDGDVDELTVGVSGIPKATEQTPPKEAKDQVQEPSIERSRSPADALPLPPAVQQLVADRVAHEKAQSASQPRSVASQQRLQQQQDELSDSQRVSTNDIPITFPTLDRETVTTQPQQEVDVEEKNDE